MIRRVDELVRDLRRQRRYDGSERIGIHSSLQVSDATRLGCEQALFLETLQVVPEALHKQVLFIFELGIEARLLTPVACSNS
jgi:hypothetical protein